MTHTCSFCGATYLHKQSLNRHVKNFHPSQVVPPASVPTCSLLCTVCRNYFNSKNEFAKQLSELHDAPVSKSVTMNFDSLQEFRAWKIDMEQQTGAFHVTARGIAHSKETQVLCFECNRSGYYKTEGQGLRHLKTQGSRKIGGYCPAEIKVRVDKDGKCTVTHFKMHWGHTMELQHLSLTPNERQRVANKVAAKVPLKEILHDIRRNISNPDEVKRLDLLTNKDLHNIKACFNLTSEYMKHKCDAVSVDAWVREMHTQECNQADGCILFYKPQDQSCDEFPSLSKEDFFLAIMTSAQTKMLELYGLDIVCIDGTHGLNGYGFQLITLMVVDDMREGFPCAFLFTNRVATETLTAFFSKIKERLGTKLPTPKVFMSDMEDSFYNAWIETMGVIPENRLCCTWHVDKAWKKHLKDVETTEKKSLVYKIVRSLMEETDETSFSQVLPLAVQKLLDDPATRVFGQYFEVHNARKPKLWAYCHRLRLGVNTNMYVESMHKCLKYFELDGKTTKRLDKGIFAVMRFLNSKIIDRVITLHKGKISSKLRVIRSRHKASTEMDSETVTQNGEVWNVRSSDGKDMYTVSKYQDSCSCKLLCDECVACIHRFNCTCIDSLISCNMCKHIHLVLMKIRSMSTSIQHVDAKSDDEHVQLTISEADDTRTVEKENLLAEVCNHNTKSVNALVKVKEETLALLKTVSALVETSLSVEEIVAAKNLVTSIPPAMAAVQESSKANIKFILQDNSNKRKIEPQLRFENFRSTKNLKTKISQTMSKPSSTEKTEIMIKLSHQMYQ